MKICYNKLQKLMIDNQMKRQDLMRAAEITSYAATKINKNEPVSLEVLMRICQVFHCDIGDICEVILDEQKLDRVISTRFLAKKAIQDYVFTDGSAEQSIERRFAEDLDAAEEVCVYAKLPRTFQIPTPVGNYSPDWAIAFYEGTVKHIFFVAETKGTMETLNLRPIEQAKISCAKKLFNEMSNSKVVYHDVDSYQSLLNIINSI